MDFKDHTIVTQVAFKAAVDIENELDLGTSEGQQRFEEVFGFLDHVLHAKIMAGAPPQQQVAEVIRANFPGSQVVNAGYVPQQAGYAPQQQSFPQQQFPQQQMGGGGLTVKGTQHGNLPDWLYAQAAEKGVTEVYDNRDRAMGTKRPWFKATVGGDNAAAFWPPR